MTLTPDPVRHPKSALRSLAQALVEFDDTMKVAKSSALELADAIKYGPPPAEVPAFTSAEEAEEWLAELRDRQLDYQVAQTQEDMSFDMDSMKAPSPADFKTFKATLHTSPTSPLSFKPGDLWINEA